MSKSSRSHTTEASSKGASASSTRPSVANKKRARVTSAPASAPVIEEKPEPSTPTPEPATAEKASSEPVASQASPELKPSLSEEGKASAEQFRKSFKATATSRPSVGKAALHPSESEAAPRPSVGKAAPRPSEGETASRSSESDAASRPSVGEATSRPSVEVTAASSPEKEQEAKGAPKKRGWLFRIGIVLLLLLVVAGCAAGAIAYTRWVQPQDAQDLQGTWAMQGAKQAITITDKGVVLAEDATFDYELDTQAKTISVSFSNLNGITHYRFSQDRSTLALIEGQPTDWVSTLIQDLAWSWNDFVATFLSKPSDVLGADTGIILYRQG